ncbi:hypothetical protein FM996_00320 [Methylosinus sporium]|uniref:Uncharacterized protein n=1 Tax=Methylosinus sporium TaxID=428 RepID=A0A549T9B1_METSR|nr:MULTISPECIES: hypothetical protein [Methylosinus]MBU3888057.1 hypothetical protein [Methylosinus sp. KRF6]TRL38446.1 hypothetical protein FM996_00320 [Methylosinus sporium]
MLILSGAVSAWSFLTPAMAQSSHPTSETTKPIPLDPSKCHSKGKKTFCPSFTLTELQFEAYQKKIKGTLNLTTPSITKGVGPGEGCPSYCVNINGLCSCPKVIPPRVLDSAEFEALKEAAKIK